MSRHFNPWTGEPTSARTRARCSLRSVFGEVDGGNLGGFQFMPGVKGGKLLRSKLSY